MNPPNGNSTDGASAITYPGTTVEPTNIPPQPQPAAVCPGCGRCFCCGRPYAAAPEVQPGWPGPFTYTVRYIVTGDSR